MRALHKAIQFFSCEAVFKERVVVWHEEFGRSIRLLALDGREVFHKLVHRSSAFEILDQGLNRNARASENRLTAHNFRINCDEGFARDHCDRNTTTPFTLPSLQKPRLSI